MFKSQIEKLKTFNFKTENEETPQTSAQFLMNKHYQQELQALQIQRKIELQEREELKMIKENLELKLEDLSESYEFISQKIEENEHLYERKLKEHEE